MINREVLIADSDAALMEHLSPHLEREQFDVRFTRSGKRTLLLAREAPAILLISWSLPDISGIEVCNRLRNLPETKDLPIILLSESAHESDRLEGLEAGADDFVPTPVSPRELLARMKAVLRRSRPASAGEILSAGDIEMNLSRHLVRRRGEKVSLALTEYRLLEALLRNPRRVLSREQLLNMAWSHNPDINSRIVDHHVRRLRKGLQLDGAPDPIRTVRFGGYSLDFDD